MRRSHLFLRRQRRNVFTHNRHGGRPPPLFSLAAIILLLFFLGAIGVVSPFAGGSTADVGGTTSNPLHRQQQQQQPNLQRPRQQSGVAHQLYPPHHQPHAKIKPPSTTDRAIHSPLFKSSSTTPLSAAAAASASTATIPPPPPPRQKKSSSLFRRILWNCNPLPGRNDGRWKGGESKATIASRLLFSYVSPLLDVAANRTLTEQDAFQVADNRKMEVAVQGLAETYDRARQKAHYKIEAKRQRLRESGSNSSSHQVKNSQTWILLKALFKYQRSALIFTAFLRLLNTGIQAFPAIITARLLRSIEAGTAEPVSKSVQAALWLVAVLSTKMIVENQLFHNVVSMSTEVRGALEGLIFDKALRLPEGGSGVMAKQNLSDKKKALGSGGVSHCSK